VLLYCSVLVKLQRPPHHFNTLAPHAPQRVGGEATPSTEQPTPSKDGEANLLFYDISFVYLYIEVEKHLDIEHTVQQARSAWHMCIHCTNVYSCSYRLVDADTISLRGVGGERSMGGEELRGRSHTTAYRRSTTPPGKHSTTF